MNYGGECAHGGLCSRFVALILIGLSALAFFLVLMTNPLFGDPRYVGPLADPFVDQTLHDLASGRVQNNWGMLFGLQGPISVLPLLLGLLAIGRRLRPAQGSAL